MANYGNELLEDFMKAWIGSTPETDGEDGFDPADVELKAAWLDFEHAGRYSLKFRNQGFDVSGFGKTSTDEETGKKTCLFWKYVTSPDVNYYDAEFETRSRPAYDAALYLEAFSDSDAFCSLSTALEDIFDAVVRHDAKRLFSAAMRIGAKLSPDGKISVDCADMFGLILSLDVFPAAV